MRMGLLLTGAAWGALLVAFLITVLELTEVVAVVYAIGAGSRSMRPAALGASGGVVLVALVALGTGLAISRFPLQYTLVGAALLLWGFGFFLLRSTLRTYVREARKRRGVQTGRHGGLEEPGLSDHALLAGSFSVGAVETVEAVVVLVALTAGGFGLEAAVGFILGGVLLLGVGAALHERIRRLKVPPLKWVATSLLFTFAVFWSGESAGVWSRISFPTVGGVAVPADVMLLPLFVVAVALVWLAITLRLRAEGRREEPRAPSAAP
jgi:uncharacterized membrane protein